MGVACEDALSLPGRCPRTLGWLRKPDWMSRPSDWAKGRSTARGSRPRVEFCWRCSACLGAGAGTRARTPAPQEAIPRRSASPTKPGSRTRDTRILSAVARAL